MEKAIEEFLGIKGIKKEVKNISNKKEIAVLYNEIKDSFRLPKNQLNKIYENEFITHFLHR